MFERGLGAVRLVVEHRMPGSEGGPTLRVRRGSDDRELLRFDCFLRGAHWHLDPAGRDEVHPLAAADEPIDHVLAELRRDLPGYLARAGEPVELGAGEVAAALDDVERALRHEPPDFDAVDPELKRASRGEKWRLYPPDVLPLWVADMDFAVAAPIRRGLQRAVDQSDLGYPVHPAPTDLPDVFAARTRERFAWDVRPDRVELLTDVMQGVYVALDRLTSPGDGVILQTPIYPPLVKAVRETGRRLLECPLVGTPRGFEIDRGALGEAAADARVLLLSHPHNPTGRAFRRDELEALARIALERDLLVVADEIHADLVYDRRHVPFASLSPEVEARTLTLMSATKAWNLAGLRTAVAVFGTEAMRRRFLEVPQKLRGGLGILGLEATRNAFLHGQPWLDEVVAYLAANRAFVAEGVAAELPGVVHHPPEATYLAWLDCRALELEPSPYQFFLERAKVALSPGSAFGPPGEGFVRLNFATSRALVGEALERMGKALRDR